MILQVKKKTITRGEVTSTHHQALSRVFLMARGNESSSSSESESDNEIPSINELVQENLKYANACTSQQKKLKYCKKS